jgi:hypothetical protein
MSLSPDNALEVLLEVRARKVPELDERLLRECYAIQKKFQYDRDREIPLDVMRRLIEQEVTSMVARTGS